MTDKEIIKALEICILGDCEICNCRCGSVGDCRDTLNKHSLDLINRQQETIKTLRNCVEQHHIIRKDGKSPLSLLTEEIKAEAIKEFAERLKELYTDENITDDMHCSVGVIKANIDDVKKEMVGDTE